MLPGIDPRQLIAMDNDKLLQLIPRIALMFQISSMCKKNMKFGLKNNDINSFTYSATSSILEADGKDQSMALLPQLMQMIGGQQPAQPVQPAVDPLVQINKSLHALHKRNDAIDEQLKKINKICEIK